ALARPVPRHQPVERDLAVVVNESVTHAALMSALRGSDAQGWLKSAALFDVYRAKKGVEAPGLAADEKSLAVRLTLECADVTLTDEQIDGVVQAALTALQRQVGARLR
ncbi:MAG: hypothetical protein RLZZ22_1515, partial [Pseudomonadota bacterium]